MRLTKAIKTLLVCGSVLGVAVWFASARSSPAVNPAAAQSKPEMAPAVQTPVAGAAPAATMLPQGLATAPGAGVAG